MLFKVSGRNIEYLPEVSIEAEDEDDARAKFEEMWHDGMIPVYNSDLDIEVKGE